MSEKILILVIDGCAIDYITKETTPNLYRLGRAGFFKTVKSAIPSVTNVNHASILTGKFPIQHGVVGNYYYDRSSGSEGFIESSHHMKQESLLDFFKEQGKSTALLTVKGKVMEVFGANAGISVNLQKPEAAMLERLNLDTPPHVASFEAYDWIMKACYQVLTLENPDLVYCTTNDYVMHNYAPDTQEAKEVMGTLDRWIGRIYDLDPGREIYITADHGMNQKSRLIDLQKKLDQAGFSTYCLLPLKDRYLENHRYQEGGAAYVYVLEEDQIPGVQDYLNQCEDIERTYDKVVAAAEFHLPEDQIGDLLVLSSRFSAFAELDREEVHLETRTHGSLYEREIPLIAVNARKEAESYQFNLDIARFIYSNFAVHK